MTTRRATLALLLGAAVVATGCAGPQPIQNVEGSPAPAGRTALQVKSAIQRAGVQLGWRIRDAGPSQLSGALHIRDHIAEIDIPYSAQGYDLRYRSSQNLNSDGTVIHPRYNAWINNLDRTIQSQLSLP